MKRQKGTSEVVAAEDKATKKKEKEATEITAKEAAEKAAAELAELWSGVVEEEMRWATRWIPFWEVESYDALYGDVLWDYDIWDLKSITNTPNPTPTSTPNP